MGAAPEYLRWWNRGASANNVAKQIAVFDEDVLLVHATGVNQDTANARRLHVLRRPPGTTFWDLRQSVAYADLASGDAVTMYEATEPIFGYLFPKGSAIGMLTEDSGDVRLGLNFIRVKDLDILKV